jgi:hypothetical protein
MTNKNNFANNKRADDAKVEAKKKIVITKETQILFLQSNKLSSVSGLFNVLD